MRETALNRQRRGSHIVFLDMLEARQLLSTAASFAGYTSVSADVAQYTVNQNGVAAALTVQLTGDVPTNEVDVYYNTADNTAVAGVDYVAESGTIAFPAGVTQEQVLIPILNSQSLGANKNFFVDLTDPFTDEGEAPDVAPYVLISPSVAQVNIQNINSAFEISPTNVSVNDDQKDATIIVQRLGVASDTETVDFSTVYPSNDSIGTEAVPGVNYNTVLTTLTFVAGQTSQTVQIPLLTDTNATAGTSENVLLKLSNPQVVPPATGAATAQNVFFLGSPNSSLPAGTGLLTINNIDSSAPSIQNITLNSDGKHISSLNVHFSKDVTQASAEALTSFGIFNRNHDGPYATGPRTTVKLRVISYDAATDTAVITPKKPLAMNKVYQFVAYGSGGVTDFLGNPVQGNGTGSAASKNYSSFFGLGNHLKYIDADGDKVMLKIKGPGLLDLRRAFNGDASSLVLDDTTPDSILSGKVTQGKYGDGLTTIDLVGPTGGVNDELTKPPFIIIELS